MSSRLPTDARRILTAQALRAFAYGFGAVLLGVTLAHRGYSSTKVGLVLTTVVVGTVIASLWLARYADRVGRRRCYVTMYVLLAVVGVVFASPAPLWLIIVVSLSGALSTDVVESGPFTSLEQPMLAADLRDSEQLGGFGRYNAVATAGGSLGALASGLPALIHHWWRAAPSEQRWWLLFVPVAVAGALVAATLSSAVEGLPASAPPQGSATRLGRSRPTVYRLCGLFALDSFGGGFVIQAFVAYWLSTRFEASIGVIGVVFFASGLLQTASFLLAIRLGKRLGLLRTMVFTHLPSNVLLASVAVAPTLGVAIGLWLARVCLSQMDVPARQAYVMALVDPAEQTSAAAYTNTARYVTRPFGPVLAGAAQSVALGLPFVFAGTIKAAYDLLLWRSFRHVPIPDLVARDSPAHDVGPLPPLDHTEERP